MGNTYGNVTLRGVRVDRVAAELESFDRTAFLLEEGDRVAVFMPEADEDPLQVAGNLSVATGGAAALAVFVFDSDLLVTWLVVDGEIRDRYVSNAELVDGKLDEEEDEDTAEPDGPRTDAFFFEGFKTYQLICHADPDVVVPLVEAAGFVRDHDYPIVDAPDSFVHFAGLPGDPHDLAQRLSQQLETVVTVWDTSVGVVGEYRSGEELQRADSAAVGDEARGAGGRPEGGDAAELCAAFGGDPEVVEGLLRGAIPVDDPTFHAESLHAALVEALGLPAATLGVGYGHLAEGIELAPEDQARLIRVG